jgi:hypothetical protein
MPAGSTYTPIATTTLGSAQATVTFSSIPSTYTDLVAVCSMLSSSGTPGPKFYLNNDTSALYSETTLNGNGSVVYNGRNANANNLNMYWTSGLTTTEPRVVTINLQNYANTSVNKSMISRFSLASGETGAFVYLYRSTSAINRIDFNVSTSSFAIGSTFTLYGIAAA